jgi:hypothetical protein
MEQLKFGNPTFHGGLNVTVRLGTKWYENFAEGNTDPSLLEPISVDLADVSGFKVGNGLIEAVDVGYFHNIPQSILDLEHDESCRTLNGLYQELKKCYGNNFHAGSLVSIVYFSLQ